ncbi:sigma-54 interaction domain-containing protein [Alkalicoccus saliphilus]|jgi:arginine utilization regulatory protein|uniref:Sigma-54-dependent Fis family transcriptional regulator n=1 Tax=Alkalicoccus saliphilus TaxID=200989 RepID=A0A2T4U5B9_9BACI|nr:sigma 54-interacting transcriptional regulator [Alkalicoccus saliphilus]PTL38586.1 sigma-54-dependent Fis family transcriptional regulator [Alkalicoccus saliphilus]
MTLPIMPEVYKQLLDAVDAGIHVIDMEGHSILYNQKMSEIEDMNKEEVLRKNIMDIFLFQSEEESRLIQALRHGRFHKNAKQTYFNFKGQEITTINDTFPLVYEGKRIGAVEIARDITKLERLSRENAREKRAAGFTFDQIIGKSPVLREVIHHAERAARTSSSVLIYGETGTGKELFAQSIHNASVRAAGPFVSQNCAALPESLIEGILFGSVKGAFTGASNHAGLFEQAEGGTLLLDEINSLSAPLQAKLLRVIQEKSVRRIGDVKDRPVDVRLIAVMNEDPAAAIQENRLREDLYYRLSVVSIIVPPLRQRKQDIPILTAHFIEKYNERFQLGVPGVSDQVKTIFSSYEWPGNVRELEHLIEGAMNLIYRDETIEYSHLPLHIRTKFSGGAPALPAPEPEAAVITPKPLKTYLEEVEKEYIETMLTRNNQNITRTAAELGVSRQSLQYRIRRLRSE